jgi:hypothetical protein
MDLYPEAAAPDLAQELFLDPPNRYRGAPFWSWNTRMEPAHLGMLAEFKTMGLGGAHLHARTGLATPYLGDEFMGLVKASADEAERLGMLLWLYDEDRWPSGYGGGTLTREGSPHRQKILVFTRLPDAQWTAPAKELGHIELRRSGQGSLLARYAIERSGPAMSAYRRLADGEEAPVASELWYAYADTNPTSRWFNRGSYLDTLSPAAVEAFIGATHERYKQAVGDRFGSTIPAIFSDEPQMATHGWNGTVHARGDDGEDRLMPWTGDLADTYRATFGCDLLDTLPELVFNRADGGHGPVRWRWHEHRAERFAEAYAGTIGRWCQANGISMTGHLMAEDSLTSQANWVGEAMRSYPHMQIPGIDMLCDEVEWCFNAAKQVQSVVRQSGGTAMLSELYGVTGWHFDFTGHKRQGDWQAALGITVRVHHLSWVSMAGEAKRDYPAPIDAHSPWWREYRLVEDHFARLTTALVRGTPCCRIAVVHPIESTWLELGPIDGHDAAFWQRDERFRLLTGWLLNGLLDFDFLAESLLPGQHAAPEGARLRVGAMAYDVVVVPALATVRASTLNLLAQFHAAGGRIVILDRAPTLVAGTAEAATAWLATLPTVPWDQAAILAALDPVREVRAIDAQGAAIPALVHQLRQDGADRWLFVANTDRAAGRAGTLAARGVYEVERWDTLGGTTQPVVSTVADGWTRWAWAGHAADHDLVRLRPRRSALVQELPHATAYTVVRTLDGVADLRLDEPNVLLLDRAEWRVAGGAWQEACEVLRLDNRVRAQLGLEAVHGDIAQPWCEAPAATVAELELRYRIHSAVDLSGLKLALEEPALTRIALDDQPLTAAADGWWVDRAIRTVALPPLPAGEHILTLTVPVRADLTREWCYLLGDFAVRLDAARQQATLIAPSRNLTSGDWVDQGLPFYAGNATLTWAVTVPDAGDYALDLPDLRAPLARVACDGRDCGPVAFAPFRVALGRLAAGTHHVAVTVFGNRANAFGPVHLNDPNFKWLGPHCYRTEGAQWSEAWCLRPTGLLAAPRLLRPAGAGD